jgi:hypothetical protein
LRLFKRIQRDVYPLWEVAAAEPDFFEPNRIIRVKPKKPLDKNAKLKIKGNIIIGDWQRMLMPYYWVGTSKFIIREVNKDTCELLVRLKAKVRIPALEEQHKEDIRRQQIKAMQKYKMGG